MSTISPRFRPGAYFKDVVTDPAKLPKDGLAGARVGSDGMAPTRSGAPTSVRRSAQPGGTAGDEDLAARVAQLELIVSELVAAYDAGLQGMQ